MTKPVLYHALADAFAAEGIETQFVLMGDGNMHYVTALAEKPGVQTIHVRHEHCACAAAMSYYIATGKVAAVSVTCGPGLTQLSTALSGAARARIPLVVLSGESPLNATYYNQAIEQAPLVVATGAHYIAAHSMARMHAYVREAFYVARHERRPVVLGVPFDLQKQMFEPKKPYQPSRAVLPPQRPRTPDAADVDEVARRLLAAKAPIVLGGRGVMKSGAREAVVALADAAGALLATTLPGRGMFDDHPFSLGVTGGYGALVSNDMFQQADLVVAIGTSLAHQLSDGGVLFAKAHVIQIDPEPRGLRDGMVAADQFVVADARLAVEAITARMASLGSPASTVRTEALRSRIATEPADPTHFPAEPGVLDPRQAVAALDRVIPKDWDIVSGSGHQAYFNAHMKGRSPDCYHVIREFGAVGNGLSFALGVAAARRTGRIALIEGDGGFIMHIQELETLKRHGLRVLMCILNDGAYGSEIHKMRADGIDDSGAIFGRPAFEAIAHGFGLRGVEVTDVEQLPALFRAFEAQDRSEVWNIQISDKVTSPRIRKPH